MNIMYSSSLKYDVALKSYCHPALVNYKSFCDFWLKYYYLSHDPWLFLAFWLFSYLDCFFFYFYFWLWFWMSIFWNLDFSQSQRRGNRKPKGHCIFFNGSHYSTNFEAVIGFDSAVESFSWSKELSNSIQQKYFLRKFTHVLAIIMVCG